MKMTMSSLTIKIDLDKWLKLILNLINYLNIIYFVKLKAQIEK